MTEDPTIDDLGVRILHTCLDLMREIGTSAVTTEAVAAAASVSKASIYKRWPSRSHLIAASAAHAFPAVEVPDLGDVLAEVRHFLTTRIEQYATHGSARLVAGLIGAAASDPTVDEFFSSWVHAQMSSSQSIFDRAIARGEFPPGVRSDDLRTIMSAPVMFRAVAEHQQPGEELVESIIAVLRAAMTS